MGDCLTRLVPQHLPGKEVLSQSARSSDLAQPVQAYTVEAMRDLHCFARHTLPFWQRAIQPAIARSNGLAREA
jgi:hypothetical protein